MGEKIAADGAMRLDRFLWWARIVRSRAFARAMTTAGHLRLNGRAVAKAAASVRAGDVLTFATQGGRVRAIRVVALPARRGPAAEAQACYDELATANVSQQGAGD